MSTTFLLLKRLRITRRFSLLFVVFLFVWYPAFCSETSAASRQQLSRWIENGAVLLHDEAGRPVLRYQADRSLIPASLIKIYTALAALDLLGEDYRFKTEFYTDDSGNLGIKGWGDPQLISEEIHRIAAELGKRGIRRVRQIVVDTHAFGRQIDIRGRSNSLNPYDALNGALLVNFNTLFLGRQRNGTVYSAEAVTPLTPLALELGRTLRPGSEERFNLSTQPANVIRYAGELFAAILAQHGIRVLRSTVETSTMDGAWSLVYTHRNSADLRSVVRGLLKYSNNLVANQIYLVGGAEQMGYPATLDKARSVFAGYFKRLFPRWAEETIVDEASGISRRNRMSAAAMMAVLERFRPRAQLLAVRRGVRVKSGTLNGVYNYAGYIETEQGLRPFVILLNQRRNQRDRILRRLIEYSHGQQAKTKSIQKEKQNGTDHTDF